MKLDEMTIGDLKEMSKLMSCENSEKNPYKIGENYFLDFEYW